MVDTPRHASCVCHSTTLSIKTKQNKQTKGTEIANLIRVIHINEKNEMLRTNPNLAATATAVAKGVAMDILYFKA